MSEELLSLFPLQVVLLPHARLPWHIFEKRYKVLVSECIKEDREFGVNLLREGEISLVYREKVEEVEEGRLDSELSFLLAQKAGMDLLRRQQLLESSSENQRLLMIKEYLSSVIPRLEQAGEIERIIRGDGYLSNTNSSEEG